MSSFFIQLGVIIVVLALWYATYRLVRWDTRRRGIRPIERKIWIVLTVVLPLFGFALYLFTQLLRGYLKPPPGEEPHTGNSDVFIPTANLRGEQGRITADKSSRQAPEAMLQQEPMPEPAWGDTEPARSNGKAHAYSTPETIRSPYQPLRTRFALFALQGPHQGQQFLIESLPIRIGRGPEAGVALDGDLNISRMHAEIYEWNGRLRVRDLGSLHGVQVNGVSANDQAISPGDRITVGGTVLILRELP